MHMHGIFFFPVTLWDYVMLPCDAISPWTSCTHLYPTVRITKWSFLGNSLLVEPKILWTLNFPPEDRNQDVTLQSDLLWIQMTNGSLWSSLWCMWPIKFCSQKTCRLAVFVDKCSAPKQIGIQPKWKHFHPPLRGMEAKGKATAVEKEPMPSSPVCTLKRVTSCDRLSQWTQTRWLQPRGGMWDWVRRSELNNSQEPVF